MKHNVFKQLLAFCTSVILVMLMAGCQGGGEPITDGTTTGESVDTQTTTINNDGEGSQMINTSGSAQNTQGQGSQQTGSGATTTRTSVTTTKKPTATSTTVPRPITIDKNKAIKVTVDKTKKLYTSQFILGSTQTHYRWEAGNPAAAMKAAGLQQDVFAVNNQHLVAFGSGYLQESKGSKTDFSSLDSRMDRLEMLGGSKMLTLCSAPGWMLVSNPASKYDAESRPKEQYFDDYAALCAEAAARYTDVKEFQVWNEFKGFWNSSTNWWDVDLYIKFYNKIYTAVKAVRPDAQVGGFYMSIRGDNANKLLGGDFGVDSFDPVSTDDPMNGDCWSSLGKWMSQAKGFDFVCFDHGIQGYRNTTALTTKQAMILCQQWQPILEKFCQMTDKPIVISEYYGLRKAKAATTLSDAFQAAEYTSMLTYMLNGAKSRKTTALLWMEENSEGIGLFTDTKSASGGKPTDFYYAAKGFAENFCKGAAIVSSTSASTGTIQVLASSKTAMLINLTNKEQLVNYNGTYVQLAPYEVHFRAV